MNEGFCVLQNQLLTCEKNKQFNFIYEKSFSLCAIKCERFGNKVTNECVWQVHVDVDSVVTVTASASIAVAVVATLKSSSSFLIPVSDDVIDSTADILWIRKPRWKKILCNFD